MIIRLLFELCQQYPARLAGTVVFLRPGEYGLQSRTLCHCNKIDGQLLYLSCQLYIQCCISPLGQVQPIVDHHKPHHTSKLSLTLGQSAQIITTCTFTLGQSQSLNILVPNSSVPARHRLIPHRCIVNHDVGHSSKQAAVGEHGISAHVWHNVNPLENLDPAFGPVKGPRLLPSKEFAVSSSSSQSSRIVFVIDNDNVDEEVLADGELLLALQHVLQPGKQIIDDPVAEQWSDLSIDWGMHPIRVQSQIGNRRICPAFPPMLPSNIAEKLSHKAVKTVIEHHVLYQMIPSFAAAHQANPKHPPAGSERRPFFVSSGPDMEHHSVAKGDKVTFRRVSWGSVVGQSPSCSNTRRSPGTTNHFFPGSQLPGKRNVRDWSSISILPHLSPS